MKHTYTVINHVLLKQMAISSNEYIVLDIIYHLSNDNDWCFASKQYIADCMGMSKSGIENIIHDLIKKSLLVSKDSTIKHLKTTDKFLINNTVNTHSQVVESTTQVVESTTNNNKDINIINIYNNIYNNIYKYIYNITPFIFKVGNTKTQKDSIKYLIEQENKGTYENPQVDHVFDIIKWYVDERKKGVDKYLPIANVPTQFVQKWSRIKELYEKNLAAKQSCDIMELEKKYNA